MSKPTHQLMDLSIERGDLVDAGDNKKAKVAFWKRKPAVTTTAKSAPAADGAELPGVSPGIFKRVGALFARMFKRAPVVAPVEKAAEGTTETTIEKDEGVPLTTGQIMLAIEVDEELREWRCALVQSINSILSYAAPEELVSLLTVAVNEFGEGSKRALANAGADATEKMATVLKRLEEAVGDVAKRDTLAEVLEELVQFDGLDKAAAAPPTKDAKDEPNKDGPAYPPANQGNQKPANTEKNMGELEKALQGVTDPAVRKAITDAFNSEVAKKEAAAKEAATKAAPAANTSTEEDPVRKAEKAELAELKKKALDQEARIAKMEDEKLTASFVAKAKKLGLAGKSPEVVAGILKRNYALGEEHGKELEELLKAQAAQLTANNQLIKSLGAVGEKGAGPGGEQEALLNKRAADIQKADPKLTKQQAYTKALAENPAAYAELQGGPQTEVDAE